MMREHDHADVQAAMRGRPGRAVTDAGAIVDPEDVWPLARARRDDAPIPLGRMPVVHTSDGPVGLDEYVARRLEQEPSLRDALTTACARMIDEGLKLADGVCPGCHHDPHVGGRCAVGDGVTEGCGCDYDDATGRRGAHHGKAVRGSSAWWRADDAVRDVRREIDDLWREGLVPYHACDVADCGQVFATVEEVVDHERTHRSVDLVGDDGWWGAVVRTIRLVAGPLCFLGGCVIGWRLARPRDDG